MTRHSARYVLPLLATLSLQLTGCGSDPPPADQSKPASSRIGLGDFDPAPPIGLSEFSGPIAPGLHRMPLIRWDRTYPIEALIEVPDGFITPGGWVVENGRNGAAYGDLMFFGDVDRVNTHPCGAPRLVRPGPSVRDLADVLSGQASGRTSSPRAVMIGGHRALYIQTVGPRDLSTCEGGRFTRWMVNPTDPFWYETDQPGTVFHVWVLAVDGRRVVVAVRVVPGHTTHAAELVHMAETAEFVANLDG
jgi:hypothetical protein